jgi:hypothetical protein
VEAFWENTRALVDAHVEDYLRRGFRDLAVSYGCTGGQHRSVSLVERNAPTGDVYIRPFVYKPAVQLTPRLRGLGDELAIYMLAMGDYLKLDRGQRALVSSWFRIPDNAIPSRGKLIGAYVNSAFAKDEAEEKGGDEAIMLNTTGKVAEGSGCNLFIVRNATLITPPITGDILKGSRGAHAPDGERRGDPDRGARDRSDRAVRRGRGVLLRHRRPGRLDRSRRRTSRGQGTDGPDHHPPPDHILRYRARPIDPLRGQVLRPRLTRHRRWCPPTASHAP